MKILRALRSLVVYFCPRCDPIVAARLDEIRRISQE